MTTLGFKHVSGLWVFNTLFFLSASLQL